MENILFKNRYRIQSARLPYWDYADDGWYFVTICTRGRVPYFGVIRNQIMELSEIGLIATDELIKISKIRPFVAMVEWAIMPNHLHAIFNIKQCPTVETPSEGVSTMRHFITNNVQNHWSPGTLGVIVNHFKRSCTVRIRHVEPGFAWQSRYFDRIIRDDDGLHAVRDYIRNNAIKHSTFRI